MRLHTLWRTPRSYSGAVVLGAADVAQYLHTGQRPAGAEYLTVPPGAVLQRGFWLTLPDAGHPVARSFLVATRPPVPELTQRPRQPLFAFLDESALCRIGRVVESPDGPGLVPIGAISGGTPLTELRYVGQVIAAA